MHLDLYLLPVDSWTEKQFQLASFQPWGPLSPLIMASKSSTHNSEVKTSCTGHRERDPAQCRRPFTGLKSLVQTVKNKKAESIVCSSALLGKNEWVDWVVGLFYLAICTEERSSRCHPAFESCSEIFNSAAAAHGKSFSQAADWKVLFEELLWQSWLDCNLKALGPYWYCTSMSVLRFYKAPA